MRTGRRTFPLVLMMLMALIWTGSSAVAGMTQAAEPDRSVVPAAEQLAGGGFATPEDAIREYLGGVVDADASRILAASAIDEMSEGFRFDLLTDRIGAFLPFTTLAPARYPLFVESNTATRSSQVLGQVRNLVYGLLSDVAMDGAAVIRVDEGWAESFASQVDPSRLSSLAIEDIRFPDAELGDDTRYIEQASTNAAMYGADGRTERLVLFSFEGDLYDIGFTLLRYGDGWKVEGQAAALGRGSPNGVARPTTATAYDQQTRGE
jgi:hypothetical protein